MFAHHQVQDGIGVAVTDRHGGVSAPPWTSLNLADHVGDSPAAVSENRRRVAAALGPAVRLVPMQQCHGAEVALVDDVPAEPPHVDAVVSRRPGLALMVQVADCTPVLMWDAVAGVIAAAHVGRRGLAAGVLTATLHVMAEVGARPDRTTAVLGPGICAEHYEVPIDMRDAVGAAVPGSATTTSAGAPALDIRAGIVGELSAAGLQRWAVLPQCTAEQEDLYSYRRDGVTGRFAGLVWRP